MEPVVRLCSAHWKADHLVSQHLRSMNKPDDDEDGTRKRRRIASQSGQSSNGMESRISTMIISDCVLVPQAKKPRSSASATQDAETSFFLCVFFEKCEYYIITPKHRYPQILCSDVKRHIKM